MTPITARMMMTGAQRLDGVREQRQAEPDKAVQAHLQRDQDDRAAGRRFGIRIRHPGMERPDRGLDAERQEEAEEQQHLRRLLAGKRAPVRPCCCKRGQSQRSSSPARKYRAMMETSITIEPTIVYRKNLTVA